MVEIIENWAEIIGILIGVIPAPNHTGFMEMHVKVEEVRSVDSYPNLVQVQTGNSIAILVKSARLSGEDCRSGSPVTVRVRAAGPPPLIYFAHPDWRMKDQ